MKRLTRLSFRALSLAIICSFAVSSLFAISFDTTFGDAGKFVTNYSEAPDRSSFAGWTFIQPSGRILLAGNHSQPGVGGRVTGIAVAGLTTSGVLDPTYGVAGKILNWNSSSDTLPLDCVMLPDGSLLVFHQFRQDPGIQRAGIIKYTVNGQLDAAFSADLNIDGSQTTPIQMTLGANG